jgi:hypothetical protein
MKTCILLILLSLSANAFAQEKLILGFDFGSTFASEHRTYDPNGEKYFYKPAYLLGIEAGYGFNDKLTLRAQFFLDKRIVYSEHNTVTYFHEKNYFDTLTETWASDNEAEYLEIPITLKYSFSGERSQGYIFAGPVIAFETGYFSKKNFGITGGIGFSRSLTHIITFFTEAGYTFGLVDVSNDVWDASYKSFSRDFRINAGLLFNIALPIEIEY